MVSIAQVLEGGFSIERYREAPEGRGRVVDPDASTTHPLDISIEDVIAKFADSISLK